MGKALKLFVLKDSSGAIVTGDDGKPLFFSDKMKAKDHKKSLVIKQEMAHESRNYDTNPQGIVG